MQKSPRGRPLETLGISEIEERVYEALLDRSGATSAELERDLALPARKLERVIEQLEQKGLATRTTGQPRRYIPASPDIAVEALVLRRQDELRRARRTDALKPSPSTGGLGWGWLSRTARFRWLANTSSP